MEEEDECPVCVGTGSVQSMNAGPPNFGFETCQRCGGTGENTGPVATECEDVTLQ